MSVLPVFIIKKWPSATFPYCFECKQLDYQVVFCTIEGGKKAISARFGNVIFRERL